MFLLVAAVILGGTLEVEKIGAAVVVVDEELDVPEPEVEDFDFCNFLLQSTFCV